MKKNSRLIALILALIAVSSLISCSAGGNGDDTLDTSAPETTAEITEETTPEPAVSVVAPPETTLPEITLPPEAEDVINLLKEKSAEAPSSLFGAEADKELLDAREHRLLAEHLTALSVTEKSDIINDVKNTVLTGENDHNLLLLTTLSGMELLTQGYLEDLSEAGIGINSNSAGIRNTITDALTVANATYLLACDGLVSDLGASYTLKYNGTALSSDPVSAAINGNFTVELMLNYIAQIKGDAFTLSGHSPLAVYAGAGGHIFGKDESGLPASALATHPKFAVKFIAASSLTAAATEASSAVFTLSFLSPAGEGEIYLPLPKEDRLGGYATPLSAERLSLLAAPAGVIDGGRLGRLVTAFSLASSGYRDSVRARLTEKSGERGLSALEAIEASATLDLGMILGWGDIDDLIEDELKKGSKPGDFLTDRVVEMRNKAVEAAAKIVAGRLETY